MKPGRTPILSFGPVNLALALVALIALEIIERTRRYTLRKAKP